ARTTGQLRRHLAPLVAAIVARLLRFGKLLVARPPDEPDPTQHRDLEHHHEEENRPESGQEGECREFTRRLRWRARGPTPSALRFPPPAVREPDRSAPGASARRAREP